MHASRRAGRRTADEAVLRTHELSGLIRTGEEGDEDDAADEEGELSGEEPEGAREPPRTALNRLWCPALE